MKANLAIIIAFACVFFGLTACGGSSPQDLIVGKWKTGQGGIKVTAEFGDIDSGDTHDFDSAKSCIVAVRPGSVVLGKTSVCDDVGEPAPLGFRVVMWEQDIDDIFTSGFGPCLPDPPSPGMQHRGPHCDHSDNDDFIGGAQLDFAAWELEAALPNVGDEYIETVALDCLIGFECPAGSGPWSPGDYSFTYRITRLPDVRVDLRSELDEAMRRSRTRSDLEAIAAGLRSLPAPSPRKIEPVRGEATPGQVK